MGNSDHGTTYMRVGGDDGPLIPSLPAQQRCEGLKKNITIQKRAAKSRGGLQKDEVTEYFCAAAINRTVHLPSRLFRR